MHRAKQMFAQQKVEKKNMSGCNELGQWISQVEAFGGDPFDVTMGNIKLARHDRYQQTVYFDIGWPRIRVSVFV